MTTELSVKTNPQNAFSFLNESQIESIKYIVKYNLWGDCDTEFADKKTYYSYGFYTNRKLAGKEWSGKMSGISKKINESGTNFVLMVSDWWQDGSGDMMFINLDLIDKAELKKWAEL